MVERVRPIKKPQAKAAAGSEVPNYGPLMGTELRVTAVIGYRDHVGKEGLVRRFYFGHHIQIAYAVREDPKSLWRLFIIDAPPAAPAIKCATAPELHYEVGKALFP